MRAISQERMQEYQAHPELVAEANTKYAELLGRSAVDPQFRTKLLTNPREAIAEFTGRNVSEISDSLNIVFVENTADATIVLPDPVAESAELSADELEVVTGGSPDFVSTVSAVVGLTVVLYDAAKDWVRDHTPQIT